MLRQWAIQVLERADASGGRKIAEALIGQILANATEDDDKTWPCRPVRDLLEELQSEIAERNLAIKLYNLRGVTGRGLQDGDKPERELAGRYRASAAGFVGSWPQTAAVLRQLADRYDMNAPGEEIEAERFRQGQQR